MATFQQLTIPVEKFEEPIINDTGEEYDVRTNFETECFKKFREMTGASLEYTKRYYKGFLEMSDRHLVVFFDCTFHRFALKQNQVWSILDEIINERRVYDNSMDINIYVLFNRYQFLTYILYQNGERVSIPCCFYMCDIEYKDYEEGEELIYHNLEYSVDDVEREKSISFPAIRHDIFGEYYYFTTDPIVDTPVNNRLKRYAVFIENTLYVLNSKTPIRRIDFNYRPQEDIDNGRPAKDHRDYDCIYFIESKNQMWCVKPVERFTEI
jgi:hypothetical protein